MNETKEFASVVDSTTSNTFRGIEMKIKLALAALVAALALSACGDKGGDATTEQAPAPEAAPAPDATPPAETPPADQMPSDQATPPAETPPADQQQPSSPPQG
jgi:hypothetical protein